MDTTTKSEIYSAVRDLLVPGLTEIGKQLGISAQQYGFLDRIADMHLPEVLATLIYKGSMYNGDPNEKSAFANIERMAALAGTTPQKVVIVLMSKHWDVLAKWSDKAQFESMQALDIPERIDDLITYLLILQSLNLNVEPNED